MWMVRTGHTHFALGIEPVGVGGYMEMTVLYLFEREQDCYRFGPVCVLCGAFKVSATQAIAPTYPQQQVSGRPITANRKVLICKNMRMRHGWEEGPSVTYNLLSPVSKSIRTALPLPTH